jgi:hypothetical protein
MNFEFEDSNKPINCLIIRVIKRPCYDTKVDADQRIFKAS